MFGANILLGSLNSGPIMLHNPHFWDSNDGPDAQYSQAGDGWEADAHLVFLSPLCQYPFTPSHRGSGLQLQNYLFVPRPHDFDNNLYKNTKNRDNNFICEGCWKLKLMIWPQGREGENPQFVQSNCDHQSILFRLTDQRRIWISRRNCGRDTFNSIVISHL